MIQAQFLPSAITPSMLRCLAKRLTPAPPKPKKATFSMENASDSCTVTPKVDEEASNNLEQSKLQKIAFVDEEMSKIEDIFKDETGQIKNVVDDVTSAMKRLKIAVKRQLIESVAVLVQKGELAPAREKLEQSLESLQISHLEEILKVSISGSGGDCLKNSINFIDYFEDVTLKAAACVVIYDEVAFAKRTGDVEILLLQSKFEKLEVVDDHKLNQTKQKISSDIEALVENFLEEVTSTECEFSQMAIDICSSDAFNSVVPKLVEKFFSADPKLDAKLLVLYSDKIQSLGTKCCIFQETFSHFKQQNLLQTQQALYLWAHARYIVKEDPNFCKLELALQTLVFGLHEEMFQLRNTYFEILAKDVEDENLGISNNYFMISIIVDFVTWYYQGNAERADYLCETVESCDFLALKGRVLQTLYEEALKLNKFYSFEIYRVCELVQKNMTDVLYDPTESYSCHFEFVKENTPKCLLALLWGESDKKCRIINKYYCEPLSSSGVFKPVFCCVACTDDHHWSFKPVLMGLVQFKHPDGVHLLGHSTHDGVKTPCLTKLDNLMIKAVDDEYIKICFDDHYLTADPALHSTDENKRQISMRQENHTDMQLWRIEFVK